MCELPSYGAKQRGSSLVVKGDDDGGGRKIRVVVKDGAPADRKHDSTSDPVMQNRFSPRAGNYTITSSENNNLCRCCCRTT